MKRELLMGLCLGAVLGTVGYACAYVITREAPVAEAAEPAPVATAATAPSAIDVLVVPITLLLVVVTGTLCGGILPLVFRRLGLDPALMSTPFVAGIIDIAGIVIYMTVAASVIGS